jgi:hypothetical protein
MQITYIVFTFPGDKQKLRKFGSYEIVIKKTKGNQAEG